MLREDESRRTFVPDAWVLRRSNNDNILDPASYPRLDNLSSALLFLSRIDLDENDIPLLQICDAINPTLGIRDNLGKHQCPSPHRHFCSFTLVQRSIQYSTILSLLEKMLMEG